MTIPPDLRFAKMSAGGNDFVVIDALTDDAAAGFEPGEAEVRRLCARSLSVGADGLILISAATDADVRMTYFNSDGGRAALCGNGVRCVARLSAIAGLGDSRRMRIETDVGVLEARVDGTRAAFRLQLGLPEMTLLELELPSPGGGKPLRIEATHVTAGVPHLVVEIDDAHAMPAADVASLGSALRGHEDLGPEGANVDFITIRDSHTLDIRCYERGVEAETHSSGSGCIASVLAATRGSGRAGVPVACRFRSGFRSVVTLRQEPDGSIEAELEGDARIIYTGMLGREAIEGFTL